MIYMFVLHGQEGDIREGQEDESASPAAGGSSAANGHANRQPSSNGGLSVKTDKMKEA